MSAALRAATSDAGVSPARARNVGPVDGAGARARRAGRRSARATRPARRRRQELDVVGVEEVGDGEEQLRPGPIEDVGGLGALEPRVERHDHAAGRVDAERGVHPLGGVRRPDRDPVAGLHARRDERAGRGDRGARRAAENVIRSRSSTSASSEPNSRAARSTIAGIGLPGSTPGVSSEVMIPYDIRERGVWAWPGRARAVRVVASPTRASPGCGRGSVWPSRIRSRRTTRCPTLDTFRNVAIAYGDDNPLWCDPDYGVKTRWEGAIAPPPLVGGDTLIGEDEVTAVAPEQRDLMKGDPLRGVHAFYAASAREWWAPLYPQRRVFRRNALVAALDKPSEFAGRAVHEWTAQVFRDEPRHAACRASTASWCAPNARRRARRRSTTRWSSRRYTDEQIDEIEAQYEREHARGAEPRWWEDVNEGDDVGPMVKGPLTVTDMICWHAGMGMGLYGVQPLRLGYQNRQAHPALLPPRSAERPRRDAARALGPGVRAAGGQPDHVRLRSDARDVAHSPLHRLDGRRCVALEARLRVPAVQLRGRHAMAAGSCRTEAARGG